MLATREGSTPILETRSASEQPSLRKPAPYNSSTRSLETGAFLFQAGDTRATIYRVVSGAFCHYMNWDDGRHDVIEFAFPGDIIGFGHLETHISSAQAMVPSQVCVVSARDFQIALDQDAQLTARLTAAADREFDVLRQRSIRIAKGDIEHRVAAFLLALSAAGATEGRDPRIISDSLTCGAAASLLNVDIEKLASALAALEAKGLIERDGKGLHLIDMEGLEALTQPN
jgi:CRP/FNR family transcriptional regulator